MSGWDQQQIDTLRRMRGEGETLQAIGDAVGMTRNAVAGKVMRLGLSLPAERVRRCAVAPRVCRPPRREPALPRAIVQPRPEPVPQPVVSLAYARPFMSRASRECAWMLDDGRSCCAEVLDRGSYCAGHRALVYRPTAKLDGEKMARRFG